MNNFTQRINIMNSRLTQAFVFATIVALGLSFIITGLMMLFAPMAFYENIGSFPPFNRHFLGDLGTFSLPIGFGLLWASRNPMQHRLLILVAVGISLMHSGNHAYDDLLVGAFPSIQTILLIVSGVLLAVALLFVKPTLRGVERAVA
jgi:uncharacterized protein YjeT (DUF2065 family)